MPSQEVLEHYQKVLKQAGREYRERIAAGLNPYPAVLDDLLPDDIEDIYTDVGMAEIPTERIVGVKSAGRTTAFTASFLPMLDMDSEFAAKWMMLCEAHLSEEGIREPVLCYEYMGNFYIQEGNKRVSVLRSFGAPRIPGNVRRVMPPEDDSPRYKAYQEFLEFYKGAQTYDVLFHRPGQYAQLLAALGKKMGEPWNQWEQRTFTAYLQYFREAFQSLGGHKLKLRLEDALMVWLELHPFQDLGRLSSGALKKTISALWNDLKAMGAAEPVQLVMEPAQQEAKSGLFNWLLPGPDHLNVAFVHQMHPDNSTWTKGHDDGRKYLEEQMADKLTVKSYYNADSQEQAELLLEQAVTEGAQVVFSTTPRLALATRKIAMNHPKVRFFNCSVDRPWSSVRSYYCRIYESKFITGAIAGAMADNDRIGYIGSSPIYGVPASINAFALGAQMTNPRARIELRWSCQPGEPVKDFIAKGYQVVSNRDVPTPFLNYQNHGEYGTYLVEPDHSLTPLASPNWLWGTFYERVIRSILSGNWEHEKTESARNYWWGMDSGVIDVEFSNKLPESMRYLAQLLRRGLRRGEIDPFFRRIVAQDGTVVNDGTRHLPAEELLHMDWLCENVDGSIPHYDQVLPFAQPMVRELGVFRDHIPPEKEADAL